MEKKDYSEFCKIVYFLAEEFGANLNKNGEEQGKLLIKFKFESLSEYDIDTIKTACSWLVKNRKDKYPPFPKIAEIIEAIKITSADSGIELKANLECDKLLTYLKYYGSTTSYKSDNQTTNYLMSRVWPWHTWAKTVKEDDIKWFRIEFKKRWIEMEEDGNVAKLLEDNSKIKLPNFIAKAI